MTMMIVKKAAGGEEKRLPWYDILVIVKVIVVLYIYIYILYSTLAFQAVPQIKGNGSLL